MSAVITSEIISSFRQALDQHPIYEAVNSIEDLQCFMEHHVYSVWDFMSLIKYLQAVIAPTAVPWVPRGDASVRRFINELVLEEESDTSEFEGQFSSHLELYHRAMAEVGADPQPFQCFLQTLAQQGLDTALHLDSVPAPSRQFTQQTFTFLHSQQPHQVAAALALGREHIIPGMFRAILTRMGVSAQEAPIFHFYLNRHIHLDEDFHAPLSLRLLNGLCGDSEQKQQEAIAAAQIAIQARLRFWDGVLLALQQRQA